jgi:hypothetical protein
LIAVPFAKATPDQVQDYVPPAGGELARHVDLGFQGPGGFYTDSAYDMGVEPLFQNIPHTASTAVFELTLEGEGVQTLDDESWAIDNLKVTASNLPGLRPPATSRELAWRPLEVGQRERREEHAARGQTVGPSAPVGAATAQPGTRDAPPARTSAIT